MVLFYLAAGFNHFYKPAAYYKIIPPFFTNPQLINTFSGVAEIFFAVLLLIPRTRRVASYGIILMLIAFIPAHMYMLKTGWCINTFCMPVWALWIRLIILQPLLIWWAVAVSKIKFLRHRKPRTTA